MLFVIALIFEYRHQFDDAYVVTSDIRNDRYTTLLGWYISCKRVDFRTYMVVMYPFDAVLLSEPVPLKPTCITHPNIF